MYRNETKGNLSIKKTKKKTLTNKTDYYKSGQTKEKAKWNQLNEIKENKIHLKQVSNQSGTKDVKFPWWHEIKTWSDLDFDNLQLIV